MHTHWDKYINIKQMLIDNKPKCVLELGALNGENTKNLIELQKDLGYKLIVISDDLSPAQVSSENITYIKGISYNEIPNLQDKSVDFCLLDTDHNYWTLAKELNVLHDKLTENALVLFHDVETYYYSTGIADGYGVDANYPEKEIEAVGNKLGSLGTCLIDFLSTYRFNYKLERWVPEGNGCAVLKKNPQEFTIMAWKACPGKGKREVVNA